MLKIRNKKDSIFPNLDSIIFGVGQTLAILPWNIFASNIPRIQIFYIVLLSFVSAYILNRLSKEDMLNIMLVFLSISTSQGMYKDGVGYRKKLLPQYDRRTCLGMLQKTSGLRFCSHTFLVGRLC